MPKKTEYKFKEPIEALFGGFETYGWNGDDDYHEDPNKKEVRFVVEGYEINFDKLTHVSELLKTKNINLRSDTRHSGGCETCDFEYDVVEVHVQDVDFNA